MKTINLIGKIECNQEAKKPIIKVVEGINYSKTLVYNDLLTFVQGVIQNFFDQLLTHS